MVKSKLRLYPDLPSHRRNPEGEELFKRRKVPEGELCAVCSDLATGYHYGVASCNGCKTFFRRTIVSEQTFICQYDGNCIVDKSIRCACRHCRFNKCIAVGMDANAIQNDRDRLGSTASSTTKKVRNSSSDDETCSSSNGKSGGSKYSDQEVLDRLTAIETLCQSLRRGKLPSVRSVREALDQPCLLYRTNELMADPETVMRELYPATMADVRMWNIKEMRICVEWCKTFELFNRLDYPDQMALCRNFAFTFNIMNRVFYSPDYGNDKIVYMNGAYIMRNPQDAVQLSGCRLIYTRQMDEIMIPFRKLQISVSEFASFKASLLFNPDALDLSATVKQDIYEERNKYLSALFYQITSKLGPTAGSQKYGCLLMMTSSIQNIIAQNEENMLVMNVFKNWSMDAFVKELCMKSDFV